jgi:hypothetical protein
MNSGTGLVETWIPDRGFEIQRRKVKTPDGRTVVGDCLVPKWSGDDLAVDRPLQRQPTGARTSGPQGDGKIGGRPVRTGPPRPTKGRLSSPSATGQ